MPVVTALRPVRGRVAVELDAAPWRTLSVTVALEAGLHVGTEIDRQTACRLARALRRERAQAIALGSLARRAHSRMSLEARMTRAGVASSDRLEVLESAERAGLVDDARFAELRARTLAERGSGDLLIVEDLVRHGVEERVAREALAALDPEPVRATRIVAARGPGPKTVRYLAARGFADETLEGFVADLER